MDDEHETVLRDRDWWQSAGDVLGLKLFGFTYRAVGSFRDPSDHDATVNLTGKVAERLIAMTAPSNPAEVGAHERKRAVAAIHWVFSADGTKSERSMADEAINKINDPTFMPLAAAPSPPIGDTGGVGEASRQIIHELAADIRDRLSHEEGSANWRNAQRIVELSRPSAALVPARVEAVDGWQPIETAPIGQRIDLWLWSVDGEGNATDGFRFPEVELADGVPYPFKYWMDDTEPDLYWPDQNGQFVSHWRPCPAPPTLKGNPS